VSQPAPRLPRAESARRLRAPRRFGASAHVDRITDEIATLRWFASNLDVYRASRRGADQRG